MDKRYSVITEGFFNAVFIKSMFKPVKTLLDNSIIPKVADTERMKEAETESSGEKRRSSVAAMPKLLSESALFSEILAIKVIPAMSEALNTEGVIAQRLERKITDNMKMIFLTFLFFIGLRSTEIKAIKMLT